MNRALPLVLAMMAGACTIAGSADQPTGPDCVTIGVTVSPADTTVRVGDTVQAQARLPACSGARVPQFRWTTSDANVAVVDSLTGLVHALRRGTASIVASDAREPDMKGAMALQVAP